PWTEAADQVDGALLTQAVDQLQHPSVHHVDVGCEVPALEAREDDLALPLVLLVLGQEVAVRGEHVPEERVGQPDRQPPVGLAEQELRPLGTDQHRNRLAGHSQPEHLPVFSVAALHEGFRAAQELDGVSQRATAAGYQGWTALHDSPSTTVPSTTVMAAWVPDTSSAECTAMRPCRFTQGSGWRRSSRRHGAAGYADTR